MFTTLGFSNWKHATDKTKGFGGHANSKEHQTWGLLERETVVMFNKQWNFNVGQFWPALSKPPVCIFVDIIEFLVSNELPLRGSIDSVDNRAQVGSGLFLSLFWLHWDRTKSSYRLIVPKWNSQKNATYTSWHTKPHNWTNDFVHTISLESAIGIHEYMEALSVLDAGSGKFWMLGKLNHYWT